MAGFSFTFFVSVNEPSFSELIFHTDNVPVESDAGLN